MALPERDPMASCRLDLPSGARVKLADQLKRWATSAQPAGSVRIEIEWDRIVTVNATPQICDWIKQYVRCPDAWADGIEVFLDSMQASSNLDALLGRAPDSED